MEKSCDNCMLKKRGDCSWGASVCEHYKYSPSVSASETKYWPEIMRSNSQSRYLEWKKDQRQLAQNKYHKQTEKKVPKKSSNNYNRSSARQNVYPSKFPNKTNNRKILPKFKETITSIRNSYDGAVLVWVDVRKTVNGKYLGLYLMEYKGTIRSYRTESFGEKDRCYYEIVKGAVDNMIKTDYKLVFISAHDFMQDIIRVSASVLELKDAFSQKKLTWEFQTYGYLSEDISEYVKMNL